MVNATDKCPKCGAMPPLTTRRGTYPKAGGEGQRHYCKRCKKFFSSPIEDNEDV